MAGSASGLEELLLGEIHETVGTWNRWRCSTRPPVQAGRLVAYLSWRLLPLEPSLQGVYDLAASVGMVAPDGRLQEAGQLEGKPSSVAHPTASPGGAAPCAHQHSPQLLHDSSPHQSRTALCRRLGSFRRPVGSQATSSNGVAPAATH